MNTPTIVTFSLPPDYRLGRRAHAVAVSLLILLLMLSKPSFAQTLDPPGPAYSTWSDVNQAVINLWNSRLTYNKPWSWGTPADKLDATIRGNIDKGRGLTTVPPPQQTSTAIYLIPNVSIRSVNLPRALHHLAAALLTYPLNAAGAPFYPAYTDSESLSDIRNTAYDMVGSYNTFLSQHTRSRHDNESGYLPAVQVPACPDAIKTAITAAWNAGTAANPAVLQAMNALNTDPGMKAFSNAQKWHCYAMRAAPPGSADYNTASGYIELDHPDGIHREYSDSNNGRIVFDYVNGKVYYTPTHYRPSYYVKNVMQQSENNFCPPNQTCGSPFFEIVQ